MGQKSKHTCSNVSECLKERTGQCDQKKFAIHEGDIMPEGACGDERWWLDVSDK
jgi:hypothetical protein